MRIKKHAMISFILLVSVMFSGCAISKEYLVVGGLIVLSGSSYFTDKAKKKKDIERRKQLEEERKRKLEDIKRRLDSQDKEKNDLKAFNELIKEEKKEKLSRLEDILSEYLYIETDLYVYSNALVEKNSLFGNYRHFLKGISKEQLEVALVELLELNKKEPLEQTQNAIDHILSYMKEVDIEEQKKSALNEKLEPIVETIKSNKAYYVDDVQDLNLDPEFYIGKWVYCYILVENCSERMLLGRLKNDGGALKVVSQYNTLPYLESEIPSLGKISKNDYILCAGIVKDYESWINGLGVLVNIPVVEIRTGFIYE